MKNLIKRLLSPFVIYRMNRREIFLTFDDGPVPGITPKIVDILKQHDVSATFFLEGRKAAHNPDLVSLLIENGHTVGYHTHDHVRLNRHSWAQLRGIKGNTDDFYEKFKLRYQRKLLRPPFGDYSLKMLVYYFMTNIRIVMWSKDSRDSLGADAKEIFQHLAPCRISEGDIILMHDNVPKTVEVLPGLVQSLKNAGFNFAAID